MYLGVSGIIIPHRIDEVTAESVVELKEVGFSGFATRFWDNPHGVKEENAERVKKIFDDNGVVITQATGYWQTLIHNDEPLRKEAVETLSEAIRVASALGADAILTGPGTLNPRSKDLPDEKRRWGAWWPHKNNHGSRAQEALIRSLKDVLPVAADYNVKISLECHVLSTIDSPEVAKKIIEEVGSPLVRINIDPVNFVGTVPQYFDDTNRLNYIFDVLDDYIISGDIKDLVLEDPVVVHLKEMPVGEGGLDVDTVLRRFEKICPDGFLHLEHFPREQAIKGMNFIKARAKELNIVIKG